RRDVSRSIKFRSPNSRRYRPYSTSMLRRYSMFADRLPAESQRARRRQRTSLHKSRNGERDCPEMGVGRSVLDVERFRMTEVPTRSEIPESDKWDLTHLFTNVDKWQEDFAWLQRTYSQIKQWKGKIGATAKDLAACLEFEKQLDQKIEKLYHFASLQ